MPREDEDFRGDFGLPICDVRLILSFPNSSIVPREDEDFRGDFGLPLFTDWDRECLQHLG